MRHRQSWPRKPRTCPLHRTAALIWFVTGLSIVAGCTNGSSDDLERPECWVSGIVGGAPAARLVPLDASQTLAIVAVLPTSPSPAGGGARTLCSGVLVAPGFVLSAAHCFDRDLDGAVDETTDSGSPTGLILVGNPPFQSASIERTWLHQGLDVVLLEADGLAAAELRPLSPRREPLAEAWVGSPAELSGYGLTEQGELGQLRFVVEQIASIDEDHVVVDGFGRSGACEGDSGGPLLARGDSGEVNIIGVLDHGNSSCVGQDHYTRVDRLADWPPFIEHVLSHAAISDTGCSGLTSEGSCLRGSAFFCDAGAPRSHDCPARGSVCGFSSAAGGFRCVSPAEDSCNGLGSFASCDGNTVVACVSGTPSRAPCGACAATCTPWADDHGAACR